jgi:hypothetical protein
MGRPWITGVSRRTSEPHVVSCSFRIVSMIGGALQAGDRIWVGGGYDFEVEWMAAARGDFGYPGTVLEFIPGQNQQPAAVIELDEELVLPDGAAEGRGRELRGKFLVLE